MSTFFSSGFTGSISQSAYAEDRNNKKQEVVFCASAECLVCRLIQSQIEEEKETISSRSTFYSRNTNLLHVTVVVFVVASSVCLHVKAG